MIGLLATLVLAPALATAALPAPADALPARWIMGDFGTPVAWGERTLYLYADIADGEGGFARNAVAVDGQFMIQPLNGVDGSFYWITDATELLDGTLLVAALEVINRPDMPNDGWAFEIVDTDLFVVRDPLDPESWRFAASLGKQEDGWWGIKQIEFSDQYPGLAFARDVYCNLGGDCRSAVIEFDPADVATYSVAAHTPVSDGAFAPVQTATGWVGVAWDFDANSATYWMTPDLGAGWVEGETDIYPDDVPTHAHGLNVIDGVVVHRYSTLRHRPTYEEVEL